MRLIGLAIILSVTLAPFVAEGQQPWKIPRIGLFHVGLDHDPPGPILGVKGCAMTPRAISARFPVAGRALLEEGRSIGT
jgi:hypothetical protein